MVWEVGDSQEGDMCIPMADSYRYMAKKTTTQYCKTIILQLKINN